MAIADNSASEPKRMKNRGEARDYAKQTVARTAECRAKPTVQKGKKIVFSKKTVIIQTRGAAFNDTRRFESNEIS